MNRSHYVGRNGITGRSLGNTEIGHFVGLGKAALASDGVTMMIALDDSNFVGSLTDVQKAFCEYYGVDYPSQIYFKYNEQFNLPNPDHADLAVEAFLPTANDEVKQYEAAVIAEAESVLAGLIMASEADYEAKIAEAKTRFEKAGLSKIDAYYEANWQTAFDKAAVFGG